MREALHLFLTLKYVDTTLWGLVFAWFVIKKLNLNSTKKTCEAKSLILQGDSGGPLVYNNEIVGIASFTIPCGTGMPDKYTRVDKYLEFIYKIMQM